jgi:hypothetical protein
VSAAAVYDWRNSYKLTAQLAYVYAKTTWSGVAESSDRDHGAASATRKDGSYVGMFGIARPF